MSKPLKLDPEKVIGTKFDLTTIVLTQKDAQLYTLSIGFNSDPLRSEDFKYTSEFHSYFSLFPTITSCLNPYGTIKTLQAHPHIPAFPIYNLLHAEERIYMLHPRIKTDISYRLEMEFMDCVDTGKNCFFHLQVKGYVKDKDDEQTVAFYINRSCFVRGMGGFGTKAKGKIPNLPKPPKRQPDFIFKDRTFPSQAFFFRLNGDLNPLHIDPKIAKKGGFERPIIHGLASYGVIARNLVQNVLGNNLEALESYEAKLTGHVFPGESFEIKAWKEGNKLHFQVYVVERKAKALVGVLNVREGAKL